MVYGVVWMNMIIHSSQHESCLVIYLVKNREVSLDVCSNSILLTSSAEKDGGVPYVASAMKTEG
jgi:hypothetical protein